MNVLHNVVHLAVGGLWLGAAFGGILGAESPRKASQIIGVVYLLVAILGFALPDLMNQLLSINMADNIALHLPSAILALYFGFRAPRTSPVTA